VMGHEWSALSGLLWLGEAGDLDLVERSFLVRAQ